MKRILLTILLAGILIPAWAQKTRTIMGTVLEEGGLPAIGASIVIPGTTTGTLTDLDGKYVFTIPADTKTVEVAALGFLSETIQLGGAGTYDVTLKTDRLQLEESVVAGYGPQKKVNLTGAVAAVSFESIGTQSRPMFNAAQALTGAVPGLQVMQGSGDPYSEGFSYTVRGQGTLNSSGPLVLVDGMQQNLSNVDPNDIASISVLKDAASCAIYGNQGANGVILVTTKNGAADGKVEVTYSATFSYDQPFKIIHTVSNYAQYMELMNESAVNVGQPAPFSQFTINQWREAEADPMGRAATGYYNFVAYPNTDWWEEIYRDKWMQKHSVTLSGRENRVGYNLSLSYVDNPGIIENTGYKRYFARVNVYSDVTKFLRVGARVWGYHTDQEKGNTGSLTSLNTQKMVPGIFPYWNGMYGGPEANEEDPQSHNPLWDMNTTRGYRKNTQLFTDFYAKVKFLKHFSYDLDFYYKDFRNETQSIDTGFGKYSYSQGQYVAQPTANEELHTSMSYNRENQYKLSSVLNYAQTIGRHEVSALAGYEESHFGQRTGSLNVKGLQDPSIGDPNSGTEPFENGGSGTEYSARSFFGRANYAFDNRYLFEANLRVDGSSRFAPGRRWGVFPSFSAGWRISQENFMKGLQGKVDNLKLRLSWGQLGNNAIGNYDWQSTYASANYTFGQTLVSGLAITSIANEHLSWETTTVMNAGLDFGFLRGRLSGSVDAYRKYTDGILYRPDMLMVMGNATGPRENLAAVSNTGVELELSWKDQAGELSYGITVNGAWNRNRVEKYKGTLQRGWTTDAEGNRVYATNIGDVSTGSSNRILEGHMINEFYLPSVYKGSGQYWAVDGKPNPDGGPRDGMIRTVDDMMWVRAMIEEGYSFYPSQSVRKDGLWYGEYLYADANGDGIYGNTYDADFCGTSTTPKYNYGLNAYLNWKGIDFSMSWSGAAGFSIYYYRLATNSSATIYGYTISDAVAKDHYFFDPKHPDDPRTNLTSRQPRLSYLSGNDQSSASSTLHLEKGDFIKLKNITLGYTLPENWTRKVYMKRVRVFATGENLFAITGFSGMDPEMRATAGYSTMRQYALGLNISF